MVSDDEIKRFQERLEARLKAIRTESEGAAESARIVDLDQQVTGRLTRMDALQQQQMALESKRRLQKEAVRIGAALDRIRGGTYGVCAKCGAPIGLERLESAPETPFCLPCFKSL